MRPRLKVAFSLAILFLLVNPWSVTFSARQSGCPGAWANGPGWAKGSQVSYNVNHLPAGPIRDAAQTAINRWHAANTDTNNPYYNGSGVQFVPGGNALVFLASGISGAAVGGINPTTRAPGTNALTSATIHIHPLATFNNGTTPAFDPEAAADYLEALISVIHA